MDWLQALYFSHEKLYYVNYLRSLKFLKSINKSVLEKKFVNYFMSKKFLLTDVKLMHFSLQHWHPLETKVSTTLIVPISPSDK